MLVDFFLMLRSAGTPVSVTEYLSLLEALSKRVAGFSVDDFYYLARAALVKDERHFDRFDRVFGAHFKGMQELFDEIIGEIPEDWLRLEGMRDLSEEEKAQIEALGGWEKLMETLRERLAEQRERHQGGSKWIGTGGTSPFGAYGYNPEGIRIGQDGSRSRRAVKVWDRREFRNLDDGVELGTRNIKVALRRLRQFARQGAADELDLDDTIRLHGAQRVSGSDIRMPERHKRGEGAVVPRRRRFHGRSRALVRGALLRGAIRVQAPRALLLPQHRLRVRVEGQPTAHARTHSHPRPDAHLRQRSQTDLHRRRVTMSPYEIILSRGQRRALERGAGRRVDGPAPVHLSQRHLAQSGTGATLGVHPVHRHHPGDHGRPHVPLTLEGLDRGIKELQKTGSGVSM